jgi:hypothetical protein
MFVRFAIGTLFEPSVRSEQQGLITKRTMHQRLAARQMPNEKGGRIEAVQNHFIPP